MLTSLNISFKVGSSKTFSGCVQNLLYQRSYFSRERFTESVVVMMSLDPFCETKLSILVDSRISVRNALRRRTFAVVDAF